MTVFALAVVALILAGLYFFARHAAALCHLRGHDLDAMTGACTLCGASVLPPIEETR